MTRCLWVGGLVVTLYSWAGPAGAQEARRSADAPPDAAATLGRPVAIRPNTPICDPGVVTASYREAGAPTPVPRFLPDAPDAADAEGGQFAVERRPVRPALYADEPIGAPPRPGPAPDGHLPVAPPVAAVDAPMADVPGALFPGLGGWAPRFYARGEYLLWWFKNDQTPPLVTTSAPADNGILTGPTTRVLFGGDLGSGSHSGGRFTAGFWLDDCETKAVEISGFFLPGGTQRFDANSSMFPVLARPFFSINRNAEFAQVTASPLTGSTGNIDVRNSSSLWGLEANLRCNLWCGCTEGDDCGIGGGLNYHIDGIAGFGYLNLHEDLSITENVANGPTAPANPGVNAIVFDDFATRNQFYGGQVGLDAEFGRGPWSLDVLGKLALGDTHQQIDINGSQLVTNLATGVSTSSKGGLLALPSNIGSHQRDRFSVVPEVDLTVSYHINEQWRIFAGYDFLYWTNVVRPGEQIDRVLNEQLIPNFPSNPPASNAVRPAVPFRQSDFWAQGLNLGVEFRY